MKYLGIDFGSKRIGVAVSDESAIMAFPLGTVTAGPRALKEILDIAQENGVMVAVMGESNDFSGTPNSIMKKANKFAEALQANSLAVEFEPEFLTSVQADRLRQTKRGERIEATAERDASAAALILQSYLDRMRNSQ